VDVSTLSSGCNASSSLSKISLFFCTLHRNHKACFGPENQLFIKCHQYLEDLSEKVLLLELPLYSLAGTIFNER
jgi:hypothetical protein